MTDDVVEAMARAIFNESGTARLQSWEQYRAFYQERGVLSPDYYAQARAAIRALHERGGLVVAKMPGDAPVDVPDDPGREVYNAGHNAALAAVRVAAVEVEG